MYNLKKDQSIVIKEADKGSAVVIWDKKDYFMEAEKQLSCKETYEEVSSDTSFLIKTIHDTLEKIRKRGGISSNILDYFNVENPKFGRFYLLPKIHKRLYDIPASDFQLWLFYREYICFSRPSVETYCDAS